MVIQTGVSSDKLRLDTAKKIGATHTIMVDVDNPVEVVADLTSGAMADVVMDIATVASTVPMAIDLARWAGGRVLLAGLKHFQPVPNLVTDWIVMKSLAVFGGSGFTPASMATAVAMSSRPGQERLGVARFRSMDEEAMGLLRGRSHRAPSA